MPQVLNRLSLKIRVTLIVSALAMGACSSESDKKSFTEKSRTLELSSSIRGEVKAAERINKWNIASVRQINVTVCVKESAQGASVGVAQWRIEGSSFAASATSTLQGCLTWSERVEFDPTAQPTYVPVLRTLIETTGRFDSLAIRFLVNPWSGISSAEPVVADPQFEQVKSQVDEAQTATALRGVGRGGQLTVQTVEHRLQDRVQPTLNIKFRPEFRVRSMAGQNKYVSLEDGRLAMRVQLVYKTPESSNYQAVHAVLERKAVDFQNGVVSVQDLVLECLKRIDKSRGEYYLLLQLVAVDGPVGLEPFRGIFKLGDWQAMLGGSHFANEELSAVQELPSVVSCQIPRDEKLIKPTRTITPVLKSSQSRNSGFYVSEVDFTNHGIGPEDTIYRYVDMALSTSVRNDLFGSGLKNGEWISMTSLEPGNKKIRAQVLNGHLTWKDTVLHNYYLAMTDGLDRKITFTREASGETYTREVTLKPWVRFLLVGHDKGYDSEKEVAFAPPRLGEKDKRPHLRLESACLEEGDRRFSLESSTLEMVLHRSFKVRYLPRVRRYDEPIFGRMSFDAVGIRPGYYRITTAAFQLDRTDYIRPVAISSQIVRHDGDSLSAETEMVTKDLGLGKLRLYLVTQVNFLDPKTLKTADGRVVNPEVAYREKLEIVDGRVLGPEELAVVTPANIFATVMTANGGSCPIAGAADNFINPKLPELAKNMREKKLDLLKIYEDVERARATPSATANEIRQLEDTDWREAARKWDLNPVELKSSAQVRQLGFEDSSTPANVERSLECAYQSSQQDPLAPAKCLYDGHNPIWELCRATALKWWEAVDLANQRKQGVQNPKHEIRINAFVPAFFSACYNDTQHALRTNKFQHIYRLDNASQLQPGFAWAEVNGPTLPFGLSLRNGFFLGTDLGTEAMNEGLVRLSGAVAASAKVSKDSLQHQDSLMALSVFSAAAHDLQALTGEKLSPEQKEKFVQNLQGITQNMMGAAEISTLLGASKNLSISVRAKKWRESFRWIFNYQIPYNYAGLISSTTLMVEPMDLVLNVSRARTCYTLETLVPKNITELLEQSESALRPEEIPTIAWYVCLPAKSEPLRLVERYYNVYNNPGNDAGAMNDNDRPQNRWFLSFRGQRDFAVFMQNLKPHIGKIYRGNKESIEGVVNFVENVRRDNLVMQKNMFPGAVSAPRPSDENYDSLENQQAFLPKVGRWLSKYFNPFEDHGSPANTDQNNEEIRAFQGPSR